MAIQAIPLLTAAIARTIAGYAGKHGTKQAIKKFGEKYGAKVVDKAQRKIEVLRKEDLSRTPRKVEVFPWAKEVAKRASKETQTGATKGSTRKIEVLRKEDLSRTPPPTQKSISRKKGGILKKNSIYGIAIRGKTKPKYF